MLPPFELVIDFSVEENAARIRPWPEEVEQFRESKGEGREDSEVEERGKGVLYPSDDPVGFVSLGEHNPGCVYR